MGVKHEGNILLIVILLGLALRLYGINAPLVDSHQVRQAQTAMMTRNLYEDHLDIFHTRLDFFGNVPGHIIMEFPLMHAITAVFYYLFGVHEFIGRFVSVAFSVGAMFLMYGLARQFLSAAGALGALVLYAVSPMNIYFSRAFMPESSMLFFMVGSIYFFLKWLERQTLGLYVTAIVFAALACLTKPVGGVIFAPIVTAWFLKDGWGMFRRFDFWLYMLFSMLPIFLWGVYANFFNATIPYSTFGYAEGWVQFLRARGTVTHWLSLNFYKFVGGSIILLLLTPLGFIGTIWGIRRASQHPKAKILLAWLMAMIAYFYVLAGANSGHIYYHLPLLPLAAILFGFSVEWLLSKQALIKEKLRNQLFLWPSMAAALLILIGYGAGYLKYFQYMYSDRMPYVLEVAEIIKKNTPGKRFILDHDSGLLTSVITYYSESKAQPFSLSDQAIADLENLRAHGATTFVTMETDYSNNIPATIKNKIFWNYLNENYKALALNEHYHIFDLRARLTRGGDISWQPRN